MKRNLNKLIITLAFAAISTGVAAQTWNIGYPNAEDVTATLADGTLTISGTGAMKDYGMENGTPWHTNNITSATIEDGITNIGSHAFVDCDKLTSITIGNSVNIIGVGAFMSCKSLTSISIPASVEIIGLSAFQNCIRLTEINVSKWNLNYYSENGVLFNKSQVALIQYPAGKQGAYTIPKSVKIIAFFAFGNCDGLTSLTIGDNVTTIMDGVFNGCDNLTSVSIGKNVNNITDGIFSGCNGITEIKISKDNANYSTENGVLFNKNKSTLILYPEGKKKETYTIPSSVTNIGINAFNSCKNLTSVTIPNSVKNIGKFAFCLCSSLASINIPNSVEKIEDHAFYVCDDLTEITFLGDKPSLGKHIFDNTSNDQISLHYPCGNTSWEDFDFNAYRLKEGDCLETVKGEDK
jgi:hypothetical protein